MKFIAINPLDIEKTNAVIIGAESAMNKSISSCLSSLAYYESIENKISSIVRSIIKNHHFKDGNKRTSFNAFEVLCFLNNREVKQKDWNAIFWDLAESNYSVEQITEILF